MRNANSLVVLSTPRDFHGQNVNKVIKKKIHLLVNNDDFRKLYSKRAILVVNKRKKNLQQLLMRSYPQLKKNLRYTKCSY